MPTRIGLWPIGVVVATVVAGCGGGTPSVPPRPEDNQVDLRPQFARDRIPVRHQGSRGSCQVMAFAAVLEYDLARRGEPADVSEQFLMWAANDATGRNRVEGFNPDLLVAGLNKHGVCAENHMPYVPRKEPILSPTGAARRDAATRTGWAVTSVKHWSTPIGFTGDHMTELRRHLDAGQPVVVTLCWPFGIPDKDIVDGGHFLIDRGIDGTSKDGHGVVLVGYTRDDAVPGGGYFRVRNSWGTAFADGGHLNVSFELARRYGTDAYFLTRTGTP